MKNTFSKIDKEQIRTASKIRAVLELQESKRCLTTTTINKTMKEANSFAKGASKSRISGASQSHKKAIIVNQKAIKSAQRASIAQQKTNDNPANKEWRINIATREASKYRTPANKRITTADRKMNHYHMVRNKPIAIAKANCNRMPKERQFTIAKHKAYHNRATTDAKYKANDNLNFCNSKEERKAKHNRKANGETRVANRNETKWDQESRIFKYCK